MILDLPNTRFGRWLRTSGWFGQDVEMGLELEDVLLVVWCGRMQGSREELVLDDVHHGKGGGLRSGRLELRGGALEAGG